MAKIRFTKNALRQEQEKLRQLETYLPTLKLKKLMLQTEIGETLLTIKKLKERLKKEEKNIRDFSTLILEKFDIGPLFYSNILRIEKRYENIAGVEIPIFERAIFQESDYFLFETPIWLDTAIVKLRQLKEMVETIKVEEEKRNALKKELKDVSIRVNLFEKILIPGATDNIRKIKIFLSDQELAAVSRSKVAKLKLKKI